MFLGLESPQISLAAFGPRGPVKSTKRNRLDAPGQIRSCGGMTAFAALAPWIPVAAAALFVANIYLRES